MNSSEDSPGPMEVNEPSLVDVALQSTLKRVSREIQLRKTGWKDCKQPMPPLYERVGNSVAYQLLLQNHQSVSTKLINTLYPALKELERMTKWLFDDYIEEYDAAQKQKATPHCLHPADAPTVKFLADLCVHVCSLPPSAQQPRPLSHNPGLWMQVLSIFSKSPQNQRVLVEHRCPSKVVGCMNLTSMSDNTLLQCSGWEVLTNVVTCPPSEESKPAVHLQAVMLLLGHIKRQLDRFCYNQQLIYAIIGFLASLSTTARTCAVSLPSFTSSPDATPPPPLQYTQGYALEVLQLLEEGEVKQLLLEIPEHLFEEDKSKTDLQNILVALAPIPEEQKPEYKQGYPPPKPRRARCRTQIHLTQDIDYSSNQYFRTFSEASPKTPSYSSEDILNIDKLSLISPEKSLPLMNKHKSTFNPSRKLIITTASESHLPKPRHSVAIPPGPQHLSHYNRLSAKRKHRGSYINAVTSSKHKPGEEPKIDNEAVQNNEKVHERKNDKKDQGQKSDTSYLKSVSPEHKVVVQALTERKELLSEVAKLWKVDKSLQAASNAVCACFFNGSADIPLFIDCVDCFTATQSHWTLGVCIVLLPYLRQIIASSQREQRYMEVVNTVVALVVKKFSSVVTSPKRSKLSSRADAEQRQACYHELHLLNSTSTKVLSTELPPSTRELIERTLLLLKPFVHPL